MTFYQALQYPFQEKGWPGRLLPLALVQLIPLVGQLILFGYGMELVRSLYAGQTSLPGLKWGRAFTDGLLLVVIGLALLTPILGFIPTIATVGTSNGHLNIFGLLLSGILCLFILIIIVGLHLLAVRYAVENKGLLKPNSIAKLLIKNRVATARFMLNAIGLALVTVLATSLGLMLLVIPGLVVSVACSLAWWYLLANFGMEIGLSRPGPAYENQSQLI